MKIAIVKYNGGNTRSVMNAVRRLGCEAIVTGDAEVLANADKIIFPGVGEASTAMDYLRSKGLDAAITSLRQPVLAICLGMQLLGRYSDENKTSCLAIAPFDVKRFPSDGIKVPHVGWNNISSLRSPLFRNVAEDSRMYFVHSYFVERTNETIADTFYGTGFSAAVQYKNFYGVQFHPEKSGSIGVGILENFLDL